MAALDFPASPSTNDIHTENGVSWKWNGSAWTRLGDVGAQGAAGTAGAQGAQGVQGAAGAAGAAGAQGATGSGTATADKIFEGNTSVEVVDTGSNGKIKFTTEGTEKVTIRTDGNLGLGIDNPLTKIHAYGSTPTITFRDNNANATFVGGAASGDAYVGSSSNHPFLIKTGNTERLRIDSAGITTFTGTVTATSFSGSGANLTGITAGYWGQDSVGLNTVTSVGVNTSTINDKDLQGIGNTFNGMYISNGMMIYDNALSGNHYIGTAFNGLMAGPVTIHGTLSVDGQYVVV